MLILYFLKAISEIYGYSDKLIPKTYLVIIILIVWLPNYLLLKKEKFLHSDFLFGYKNGILVVLIISFTVGMFLITANKNRKRIFINRGYSQKIIDNGGREPFDPDAEQQSLEEDIRLWYYKTFEKENTTEVRSK